MQLRHTVALSVLVMMAAGAVAADVPQTQPSGPFVIKFDRGFQAGQAFVYTMTHSDRTTQKIETPDGQTNITESSKTLTLEGDMTIMKVDDAGRESSIKLVIKRFTRQSDSGPAGTLLPSDTALTIGFPAGGVTFALAGGESISDEVQASLQQLFHARPGHAVSDDDRFGNSGKKSVGDTWSVNAKALAVESIPPDQISGTVDIRSVKNISGLDCLQLETNYAMHNVPIGQLPPGAMLKESTIKVLAATDLPIDTARPKMGSAVKSNSHIIVEQRPNNAGVLRTTIDSEISRVTAWTPKM